MGEVREALYNAYMDTNSPPLMIDGDELVEWPLNDGGGGPAISRNGPGSGPADDGHDQHDVGDGDDQPQDQNAEPPQG